MTRRPRSIRAPQQRLPAEPSAKGGVTRPASTRARLTRARLLIAARAVFEKDGFLEARITDISATAGVAHGTFYTYFTSKEEIFRVVVTDAVREMLEASGSADRDEKNPVVVLRNANARYLREFLHNGKLMLLWEHVAGFDDEAWQLMAEWRKPFIDRAERAIRRLQSSGMADEKIDPQSAAMALTGMVRQFTIEWFQAPDPEQTLGSAIEVLTRLWANALGIPADLTDHALSASANVSR